MVREEGPQNQIFKDKYELIVRSKNGKICYRQTDSNSVYAYVCVYVSVCECRFMCMTGVYLCKMCAFAHVYKCM